jgi:hypothetical protein
MSSPQCSHIGGTKGFTKMGVTSPHSVHTVTSWQIVIPIQLNCFDIQHAVKKTPYKSYENTQTVIESIGLV